MIVDDVHLTFKKDAFAASPRHQFAASQAPKLPPPKLPAQSPRNQNGSPRKQLNVKFQMNQN